MNKQKKENLTKLAFQLDIERDYKGNDYFSKLSREWKKEINNLLFSNNQDDSYESDNYCDCDQDDCINCILSALPLSNNY